MHGDLEGEDPNQPGSSIVRLPILILMHPLCSTALIIHTSKQTINNFNSRVEWYRQEYRPSHTHTAYILTGKMPIALFNPVCKFAWGN